MPSGLSPQYIMRASLCRKPDCANGPDWKHTAESEIENLTWYPDYAEPGYTAGERGVLAANWNYFTRGIDTLLERAGFDTQWSDEWTTCDECGKAIRKRKSEGISSAGWEEWTQARKFYRELKRKHGRMTQ